jgi:subtilisin family serine protease
VGPQAHAGPWGYGPAVWGAPPRPESHLGATIAAVVVGVMLVPLAVLGAAAGWGAEQLGLIGAGGTGFSPWVVVAGLMALLGAGPSALIAFIPKSAPVRAAGRAWLIAAGVAAGLTLLRLVPSVHHELYLALFTLITGVAAGWLWRGTARVSDRRASPLAVPGTDDRDVTAANQGRGGHGFTAADLGDDGSRGAAADLGDDGGRGAAADLGDDGGRRAVAGPGGRRGFAIAAGLAVLVPWLWIGALGGVLETILAGTAAAAVGLLAAGLLGDGFWQVYGPGPVKRVLLGGTVAGLALLLLSVGTAQSGSQLAEVLVLPPLGYALAALHLLITRPAPADDAATAPRTGTHGTGAHGTGAHGTGAATAWLVGLAAFGPIAFTDPEEVTLLLSTGKDVPAWTAIAASMSWVVAVLVGVAYAVGFVRLRPRRWAGAITAAVVLIAATGVYAVAGQPGLYGDRLFVILKEQADLSGVTGTGAAAREARVAEVYRRLVSTADRSQADLRAALDDLHLPYTPYYLVNGIEVAGGPEVRAWLSGRDEVDRVLVAQQLRPLVAPPGGTTVGTQAAPATPQWNLTSIGAARVVSELKVTGSGITVGSSDSGVDGTHPALAATFRGGDDSWYDPWDATRSPVDGVGHGTHTLASAVGSQNVGVAPGASWTGCVNLDRNLGDPAHYLDCMQFMFAPFPPGGDPFTQGRPGRAPQVLTNSWGCPDIEGCDRGALRSATAAFAAAGTFFVAAAGNSGPGCATVVDPPSLYPDVLTVGAVNERGWTADFSSRGPAPGGAAKPDLMAPGANVLSALPGGGYGEMSGTSMAAPHVAGVVALMWSAQPKLVGDLAATTRILRGTSVGVVDSGRTCGGSANVTGSGRVDAYAAVHAAQAFG